MYQYISKVLPRRIRHSYHDLLTYCDVKIEYDRFIGFIILFGLGVALVLAINIAIIFSLFSSFLLIFLLTYIGFEIVVYMWLSLSADSRGRFVDTILPDALQLMSMNIKAGMTTDKALLIAARPEFGPLEKELNKAGKEVLSGKEIKYALLEIPRRVKSELLDRTIKLIIEGIESGGELSDLLEQTSEDIHNTKIVQQEVRATVLMYAIFIFFAAGIGAPILFGISTHLVSVLSNQFASYTISDIMVSGIKIGQGQLNVGADFLRLYAILSLTITSIFGGLIIGAVKTGDSKNGVKTIPLLFLLSIIVFFVVSSLVSNIFSGL